MKRSAQVRLWVIGTITILAGCRDHPNHVMQVSQNTYASQEDCQRDWGNDGRNCHASGAGGGGYLGPRYYWDHSTGMPYAIDSDGRTRPLSNSYLSKGSPSHATSVAHASVSRGGFGSTGRGLSLGG